MYNSIYKTSLVDKYSFSILFYNQFSDNQGKMGQVNLHIYIHTTEHKPICRYKVFCEFLHILIVNVSYL